jgi:hypothetical protein
MLAFIQITATLLIAVLIWMLDLLGRLAGMPVIWFRRHVYYRAAPFRSVEGPYVLVLRSFANRMVIGRRVRRVFRDRPCTGRSVVPRHEGSRRSCEGHSGHPDGSRGLLQEVEHVVGAHPEKVAFLMPPSDLRTETRWDVMREYRFEPMDMSEPWTEAADRLRTTGATLREYDREGGFIRCHADGSLCEAKWGWTAESLIRLIATTDSGDSDARQARKALRAIGLRLLLYQSPPDVILDRVWYERPFSENHHIRDARQRRRLAALLPWLGLNRRDHVMNAPLPGRRRSAGTGSAPPPRCSRRTAAIIDR